MIAGHIDDIGTLAGHAQDFLNNGVVARRPVPGAFQAPSVDDVADEVNGLGFVVTQEVEQEIRLAARCAEMGVGNEERAVARGVLRARTGQPFVEIVAAGAGTSGPWRRGGRAFFRASAGIGDRERFVRRAGGQSAEAVESRVQQGHVTICLTVARLRRTVGLVSVSGLGSPTDQSARLSGRYAI